MSEVGLSSTGRPLRQRKSVAKFGNMVDSDDISDPEEDKWASKSARSRKSKSGEDDESGGESDGWGGEETDSDGDVPMDDEDEEEEEDKVRVVSRYDLPCYFPSFLLSFLASPFLSPPLLHLSPSPG